MIFLNQQQHIFNEYVTSGNEEDSNLFNGAQNPKILNSFHSDNSLGKRKECRINCNTISEKLVHPEVSTY
jgi:hypothetical protein